MSAEVQREQIKTWTCLEPRAAATVGWFLGELGRRPVFSERLRRWGRRGVSTDLNGSQRICIFRYNYYYGVSATVKRLRARGSARPHCL